MFWKRSLFLEKKIKKLLKFKNVQKIKKSFGKYIFGKNTFFGKNSI